MATLQFVHISDTHINPDPGYVKPFAPHTTVAGAHALVRALNALPFAPDFVLHTGDVAYDPDPAAYAAVRDIFAELRWPIYYLAGNHDDSAALQTVVMGQEAPQAALHYTFTKNGVQVVAVDSNGPAEPPGGFMTEAQLDFLREQCRPDDPRPLVIAVHHNMLPVGIPWLDDYMRTRNGEAFHQAILPARDRMRGVFYGHVHQHLDTVRDGILYASTRSTWTQLDAYPGMTHTTSELAAEPGYSLVTVTDTQTFIRRSTFSVTAE